jgi:hypothetical protein
VEKDRKKGDGNPKDNPCEDIRREDAENKKKDKHRPNNLVCPEKHDKESRTQPFLSIRKLGFWRRPHGKGITLRN